MCPAPFYNPRRNYCAYTQQILNEIITDQDFREAKKETHHSQLAFYPQNAFTSETYILFKGIN